MNLQLETSVPVLTVFIQGLLSFFSPCVLPLVPLYVGYLAGGARTVDEKGNIRYPRGKVLVNTLFFVIGVSFAFFLLGFGFTALGRFFSDYRPGLPGSAASSWCSSACTSSASSARPRPWSGSTGCPCDWTGGP